MKRTNGINIVAAAGVVAVLTTGCGRLIERVTEEAVEQAVESESGEDVEIDFSDGQVRVESSEGDITFSADEDGVQIDGTDADGNDFSVEADENGLEVDSEDGTLDVDDDGTFVATDGDGEVITGGADDDGGFTVEDSEGDEVFATSDGFPEQWPDDVPQPEGLSDVTGTFFTDGDAASVIVTGTASGSVGEVFDRYADAVQAAGFDETSMFTQGDDASTGIYERDGTTLSVSVQSVGDGTEVVVALG